MFDNGSEFQLYFRHLLNTYGITKKPWTGPYTITAVHTNGTIGIQRGALSARKNIRRVKPFFGQVSET